MARTLTVSASCTCTAPRRWRLFLVVFLVRMWRLKAWPRLTVPPGRTRNRLAALFLVFILDMTNPCTTPASDQGVASRPVNAPDRAPAADTWDWSNVGEGGSGKHWAAPG